MSVAIVIVLMVALCWLYFKRNRKIVKIVKDETDECEHDWEIVSICKELVYIKELGRYMRSKRQKKLLQKQLESIQYCCAIYYGVPVVSRVCLKCGECDDGISHARSEFLGQISKRKEANRERILRAKLARKMWEDGCKGQQ